ncbi:EAL domain-containing protein [Paraburkholderia sp. UCT2]|uniref:EAL domain-containing protein n=1 Tax=Paraburkholderia sp. UCT2 TaxID=2615208 RepID=UPI001655FC30|nr:EAL domain-containing protein [Paraburkholderia sp. UCT2]MBC8730512.1 EAL domain-containing protein [Paraburkholderia sp. UCT2]
MIKRMLLISAYIALGCAATVLPVLISIYIANEDVTRREQRDLRQYAEKAVMRTELVTYQGFAAIADLQAEHGAPCSPEYLERAAHVIFNYRYVRDAGAYGDGRYLCSPLFGDVRTQNVELPPPRWRSNDGYLVWFQQKNPLSDVREDIQIGRNGEYVSIDPQSYVDVMDPAGRPIATINTDLNSIVALSTGADPDEMLHAWKRAGRVDSDEWNYAVARSATRALGVVVKGRRTSLLRDWPGLLAMWLSIGVAMGAGFGWVAFKRISRQVSFLASLEWAISRKIIDVAYQPIVSLATNECVGVEALARWNLNGREISPHIFIALAEQHGLIQSLTDLVLDKALHDLTELLRSRSWFYVSVNVSGEDLRTPRFLNLITARLAGTGLRAAQIRIEATERSCLNADVTRQTIAAFRSAGHPVYIDDFGTGYSSLAYLQTFMIDALKIDKSFVDTIARDAASSIVAPHIIDMAHELGVEVVAEGIERDEQVEYLLRRGVQYGQGWLFAKAMHREELVAWLEARHASHAPAQPAIQ